MTSSLDHLLYNDFAKHTLESQIRILMNGRPRPEMPSFRVRMDKQYRVKLLVLFNSMNLYDRHDWLTGCSKRNRLYCWPCLLMGKNRDGFTDWNTKGQKSPLDHSQLSIHEKTDLHFIARVRMLMFTNRYLPDPTRDDVLHNSIVQRNRTLLGRVIDAAVVLVQHKRRSQQGRVDPLTAEECVDVVRALSRHCLHAEDPSVTEDATFLLRNSPSFLSNVVDAISNVLKATIKKEAHGSAFVSVILNGHRRTDKTNLLRSAVLRYLKSGKVIERCVGFFPEDYANRSQFYQNLTRLVSEFQLSQRVVSLAVDGLCPFTISNTLSPDIVSLYPYTKIVPCYFHQYWDVMVQMLSCNQLINTYDPSAMCTFFEMTESMRAFLRDHRDEVEACLLARLSVLDLCDSTKNLLFLNWVKIHRKELIEYFNQTSRASDKWREEDLARLRAFANFLAQFSTVFWLMFFIRLFTLTKQVNKVLCSQNPETLLVTGMLQTVMSNVVAETRRYDAFWTTVVDYFYPEMAYELQRNDKQYYLEPFRHVLTCVTQQTSIRLGHLRCLAFFKLLNPSNFYPTFTDTNLLLLSLGESYETSFSVLATERELHDLYRNNRALLGYSIEQLLEYMTRYESRRKTLPNMIKLAELVLSMPCIKPSDARPPVIQKVLAVAPALNLPEVPDFSVLYVENELLEEARSRANFHDEVIEMFGRISTGMDLLHFQ